MKFAKLIQAAAMAVLIAAAPASAEVIKTGATPTGVPFNYLDPETNKMTGFLLDIANEMAKRGGFEIDLQTVDFQSLVPALQSGRIDIITSSFSITEQRAKIVDFAVPIYSFHGGLLVPKGNPKNLVTYEDLAKARIGTNMGNAIIAKARENGIEFALYSTIQDALRDLHLGRIDGAVIDMPIADRIIQSNPDYAMEWENDFKPFLTEVFTFSVRKGDKAMLDRINPLLTSIKTDGTLAQLIEKWKISVSIAP